MLICTKSLSRSIWKIQKQFPVLQSALHCNPALFGTKIKVEKASKAETSTKRTNKKAGKVSETETSTKRTTENVEKAENTEMVIKVLNVAEKNDAAKNIAQLLSNGTARRVKQILFQLVIVIVICRS